MHEGHTYACMQAIGGDSGQEIDCSYLVLQDDDILLVNGAAFGCQQSPCKNFADMIIADFLIGDGLESASWFSGRNGGR